MILKEILWRFCFSCSYIRCLSGGKLNISSSSKISHSTIIVYPEAQLTIDENVEITNTTIIIQKGFVFIGNNTIIKGNRGCPVFIQIDFGNLNVAHHCFLGCEKIWVRFNGNLVIGPYTNINKGSELRCDERVEIGSYCQISYNVRIWDTNTHEILPKLKRRERTEKYFPIFGKEINKPVTSPVKIGDDCWIGEYSAILKGSQIGDECILGFRTTLIGEKTPNRRTIINKIETIVM